MGRIVSAFLGIALVIAGGAAIHFRREAGKAREQIAHLEARISQDAGVATQPVTQATQAPTFSDTIALPADTPAPASAPAQPGPGVASPDLSALRAQVSSPETAARAQALVRTMFESNYPDLREVVGLSADEAEKLLALLAANNARLSDAVSSPGNASISPQEGTRRMAEHREASEAAVQAMLGSKYSRWQEYEEARPAYQQRRDLRAVLDAAGTPMTDVQDKSLIAALSAEQRNFDQQTRDAISQGKPFDPMARDNPERHQRLLDAAAPHLSPQQLESYRAMLDRAAQRQAIFSRPPN